MSQSSRHSSDPFAEAGAWLKCFRKRDGQLASFIKRLLRNGLPFHFVVSAPLAWTEQPSAESDAVPCQQVGSSSGTTMNNLVTMAGTVLLRPSDPCDDTSSSENNSSLRAPAELKSKSKTKKGPSKSKSDKKSKPKSKSVKLKVKKISAKNVEELYAGFGLDKKKPAPLKGRGGSSGSCNTCTDPDPDTPTCDTPSSESCDEECVKGCVPCDRPSFPRLRPYAVMFNFTFTRLRGTLQNCNSLLVHNFSGRFTGAIESQLRASGINLGSSSRSGRGFLSRLPALQTTLINGYSGYGQQTSLVATLDFRRNRITLGRSNVNTVNSVQQPLWGPNPQPTRNNPYQTQFGIAPRNTKFFTNFFNLQFVVNLSDLSRWERILQEDIAATGSGGGRRRSSNNNNNNDSLDDTDDWNDGSDDNSGDWD